MHKIAQLFMFIHKEIALKRPSTYIILFYTMSYLKKINFKTKSVKNIHQDAPNLHIFSKFSHVAA